MLTARIKNGEIIPDNPKYFQFQLSKLEGKRIKIDELKNTRSLPQNSYYWGVVLQTISESIGHTPEELHSIFKRMFLPKKFVKWRNIDKEVEPTTTGLSTGEMVDYINKIIIEASHLGITIEPPNELHDLKNV